MRECACVCEKDLLMAPRPLYSGCTTVDLHRTTVLVGAGFSEGSASGEACL